VIGSGASRGGGTVGRGRGSGAGWRVAPILFALGIFIALVLTDFDLVRS
jgi:hypothetical protein